MTPLWPLQKLVDTTIRGDAVLAAKLRGEKVYSLTVPSSDDALPYILLAQSVESDLAMFENSGWSNTESFSGWSADKTKEELAGINDDMMRLFKGTRLSLDGYHFVTGELTLIRLGGSADGRYSQANWTYEVLSHG